MVYMLRLPRPIGVLPAIYKNKPTVEPPRIVEDEETGYFQDDPFSSPDIVEFNSEFEARRYYKEHYPSCYNELKTEEYYG